MQTKRQLRREIRELERRAEQRRREAIAARGDAAVANGEAETWKRRAYESADKLIAANYELRELQRRNAAYERAAHRELLGSPTKRGHGAVLEVAS